MPITETYFKFKDGFYTSEVERTEETYLGCVVKLRTVTRDMNWSDTLDYTDIRGTECVEALCYEGREDSQGREIPVAKRFSWHNTRSLFVDRGQPARSAKVDPLALVIPQLLEDLEAWLENERVEAEKKEAQRVAWEASEKAKREEAEKNRPVVGKQMRVKSGRKVPVGTVGTVAYIKDGSRVLLKADSEWRDRKANGVWVEAKHLEAR